MECDEATCMICNEVGADNGPILGISELIANTSADNVLCVAKLKLKDFPMKLLNVKNTVLVEFLLVPEIVC